MKKTSIAKRDDDEAALLEFLRAIAARDQRAAASLLAESPSLARRSVSIGATRQDPKTYFFTDIRHYAYAGDTALHLAAAAYLGGLGGELISQGANVRARNRRGAEPLHYACDGSPGSAVWNPEAQRSVVELLVRAGADPNVIDKSGVMPLHRAVRSRSTGAVRALLANGADVRAQNGSGSTPLHLAVQDTGRSGSGSAAALEEQREIIQLLLASGARPSDKDAAGKTVLDSVRSSFIRALLG